MVASNKVGNMTEVFVEQNNVSVVDGIKNIILRKKLVEIKESVINKIPYFETLFSDRFPTTKNDDGVIISNDLNPEIIKVIIQCVEINKFTDLFTLLPCDEHVVDLFDTLQFLCIELPFVVDETILTHSYKVSELNLISKFEPISYIIVEFAFNLFQMKKKKLKKEEKDKLVFLVILHLLLKDIDVKQKEHLRKFSFQVLELTMKQKYQVEQIDLSQQIKKDVINAVLTYWQNVNTNFLRFYKQHDDPIQFFHLIKYLKLKLPFQTTQKYIKSYLTAIHGSLPEDDSLSEEDTMTKLAYLLFFNKNKLSVNTMENIITKACGMISVIKSPVDFVVCKHLKTIVTLYCPTVTYEQKARLGNQIGRLEHMFCAECDCDSYFCGYETESDSDFCGYDEDEELRYYFDRDPVDNEM